MKNIMTIQYGQKEKKEERRKRREKESDQQGSKSLESSINHPIWSRKRREEREKKSDQQGSNSLESPINQKYIECIFKKWDQHFSIYFKFDRILISK